MDKNIAFITGTSGFIGFHLANLLLKSNWQVIGFDGLTDYYDVSLKKNREQLLKSHKNFVSHRGMLEDRKLMLNLCKQYKPSIIIHLAAQAGVRYSINNPKAYFDSNMLGTFNVLEISKEIKIKHLLIASTSSVYGSNTNVPFDENQKSDTQMSFYAATKKANEVMSHSYAHIYNLPTTVFRFFTVYGPWGRPDMALFKFTKSILEDKEIDVYNFGDMKRDFTYVDDLVKSIKLLINKIPDIKNINIGNIEFDSISNVAPWRVVNIGNSHPTNLLDYIEEIEKSLGIKAKKKLMGMQKGDVKETSSDVHLLEKLTGFKPNTPIKIGIKNFVEWYKNYYKVN